MAGRGEPGVSAAPEELAEADAGGDADAVPPSEHAAPAEGRSLNGGGLFGSPAEALPRRGFGAHSEARSPGDDSPGRRGEGGLFGALPRREPGAHAEEAGHRQVESPAEDAESRERALYAPTAEHAVIRSASSRPEEAEGRDGGEEAAHSEAAPHHDQPRGEEADNQRLREERWRSLRNDIEALSEEAQGSASGQYAGVRQHGGWRDLLGDNRHGDSDDSLSRDAEPSNGYSRHYSDNGIPAQREPYEQARTATE